MSVSQGNGEFIFGVLLCLPVGRGEDSTKEQWCLLVLQSLERAALTSAPPVPALKPVNSVSPVSPCIGVQSEV